MEEKQKKQAGNGNEKGSSKRWIVLIILCAVILVGAGGAVYHFFLPHRGQAQGNYEESLTPEYEYAMDSFVVNLAGQDHRRYLRATMIITYHEEKLKNEIISRMPEIRNGIIDILRSKTMDDVQKDNSTLEIRKQVVQEVNSIIKEGNIEGIYFTEFIIQ